MIGSNMSGMSQTKVIPAKKISGKNKNEKKKSICLFLSTITLL